MLAEGPLDRAFLSDPSPDPNPTRRRSHDIEQITEELISADCRYSVMEGEVGGHEFLNIGVFTDLAQEVTQLLDFFGADSGRGLGARGRLEHPAYLEEVEDRLVTLQFQNERHGVHRGVRPQIGDVGPIALADVQDVDHLQRLDSLAQELRDNPNELLSSFSGGKRSPGLRPPDRISSRIFPIAHQ
jgi:hypothetical protein